MKLRVFGYQTTRLSTLSDAPEEGFEKKWSPGNVKLQGPDPTDDPTLEPLDCVDSQWAYRTKEEVTELAKNRYWAKTAKRTAWAVKFFKGWLNMQGLYKYSWALCIQKIMKMNWLNNFPLFCCLDLNSISVNVKLKLLLLGEMGNAMSC